MWLELVVFLIGILYGYFYPYGRAGMALLWQTIVIGIILAIILVVIGILVSPSLLLIGGLTFVAAALVNIILEVIILVILFIVGSFIGGWLRGSSTL